MLDCLEPEYGWRVFQHVLAGIIDKHVPLITIKNDFSYPWFDSECFEAYRDKGRAHKNINVT